MLNEESLLIRDILAGTDLSSVKEILDVGSSTKEFRTLTQSYIDENVFKPLREKNISIYYMDKKKGEGIDLAYDVEYMSAEEIGKKFDMIICCSLLEHVQKPWGLATLLMDLLKKDGYLMVTVPQKYRYHPDPIDTGFRPSMNELVSLFPGLQVIRKAIIRVRDKSKYSRTELIRYIVPFLNWKVNCLFMKKGNP
ncbi:MAG: class I SAM-dependent methyltransferase [Promethearchaeota archaeon]